MSLSSKSPTTDLVESLSGVRGVYNQGITPALAYQYACAYAQLFVHGGGTIVIANDSRSSTPALKAAMLTGFHESGVATIDLGVVPVQVCEYAVTKYQAQGGIYLTASHNEPEYNGWKPLKVDGALLYPQQMEQLIARAHEIPDRQHPTLSMPVATDSRHDDSIERYVNYVIQRLGADAVAAIQSQNFKLLVDPNGGSSLTILPKLFERLNVHATLLNSDLGIFNRLIEPNIESLAYLNEYLRNDTYIFAAGFDCDADRVELVIPPDTPFAQQMGPVLSGQYVLALACDALLAGTNGQVVVTNDCTSYLVREVVKKHNTRMYEVEVGEINVVQGIEEHDSIIGGEGSNGGVIMPPIKCRDGIMTVALMLKMLAEKNTTLSDILSTYPRYYSERIKMHCSADQVAPLKKKLEDYLQGKQYRIMKTGDVTGGLKALADENSYVWFRPSKTEGGVFRIIADGDEKQNVTRLLAEGVEAFNNCI